MEERDVILSIDIGTTNVKVAAFQKNGKLLSIHYSPLKIIRPHPGWCEINPDQLWDDLVCLMRQASEGRQSRIAAIGISTQRGTFLTWNKVTSECLHNFITWADLRSAKMCDDFNNSYIVRMGKTILWLLGSIVGSTHMICAANFTVRTSNVHMRLKWVMENIPTAAELEASGNLRFGTLDSWLINKLTGGTTWVSDYTNAVATGLYDMWDGGWCPYMATVFGTPFKAMPEVRDCNAFFGHTKTEILGISVPVCGVMGDVQASMVGNRIVKEGDFKLTFGTCISGSVITGSYIHPVATTVFPQLAWKLRGQDKVYMAESMCINGSRCLDWAVTSGLVKSIEEVDSVASSVHSTDGIMFPGAITDSFVGLPDNPNSAHQVRAILEAHVFKSKLLVDSLADFYGPPNRIVADGGASKSNFILSNLAKLSNVNVLRCNFVEGSLMGAFLMAGLGIGWWESFEDIPDTLEFQVFPQNDDDDDSGDILESFNQWSKVNKALS